MSCERSTGPFAWQLVEQGVDFVGLLQKPNEENDESEEEIALSAETEVDDDHGSASRSPDDHDEMMKKGKLVDDEERETGAVAWSVYGQYLLGCGGIPLLVLLFIISVCLE